MHSTEGARSSLPVYVAAHALSSTKGLSRREGHRHVRLIRSVYISAKMRNLQVRSFSAACVDTLDKYLKYIVYATNIIILLHRALRSELSKFKFQLKVDTTLNFTMKSISLTDKRKLVNDFHYFSKE